MSRATLPSTSSTYFIVQDAVMLFTQNIRRDQYGAPGANSAMTSISDERMSDGLTRTYVCTCLCRAFPRCSFSTRRRPTHPASVPVLRARGTHAR